MCSFGFDFLTRFIIMLYIFLEVGWQRNTRLTSRFGLSPTQVNGFQPYGIRPFTFSPVQPRDLSANLISRTIFQRWQPLEATCILYWKCPVMSEFRRSRVPIFEVHDRSLSFSFPTRWIRSESLKNVDLITRDEYFLGHNASNILGM